MAVTLANIKKESVGSMWAYSGTFTSAARDSSATITHGFNYVADGRVTIHSGAVGTENPKITNSAGVATVTFNDTLGYSGEFYFLGK